MAEYEVLGLSAYGETLYQKQMTEDSSDVETKYRYAMFALKHRLRPVSEVLPYFEEYLSQHSGDDSALVQYVVLLVGTGAEESCRRAWVLLRELIEVDPTNLTHLYLAVLLFQDYLNQPKQAELFLLLAERVKLRQDGHLGEEGGHKEAPLPSELPSLGALPSYSEALSEEARDALWL